MRKAVWLIGFYDIFAIKTRNTTCLGGNHLFKLVLSPPNIVGHCLRVLSLLCSVSPQVKLLVPQCPSWGWTLVPCSPVLVWLLAPLCRQTAGQPAPGSSDHSHPGIMMNGCWIHLHRHSVNQTHRKVSCFTWLHSDSSNIGGNLVKILRTQMLWS